MVQNHHVNNSQHTQKSFLNLKNGLVNTADTVEVRTKMLFDPKSVGFGSRVTLMSLTGIENGCIRTLGVTL